MATITDTLKGELAPSEPESGTFQGSRVIALATGHAVHDMFSSFLSPLLVTFTALLGLSKTQAGLLMIFQQGPSVLQPVIGNAADRVNLRYLAILGPAVTAAMMTLLGVAPNYTILAVLLFVGGLSLASFHAVAAATAGSLSGRRLGRGIGFWMVGGELGYAVGPVLVVTVIKVAGLRNLPWLMIIGFAASAFLFVKLRSLPTRAAGDRSSLSWRSALRDMRPVLVPMLGVIIMRSLLSAGLSTYLPMLLTEQGSSLWFAGASLSLAEGAGMFGALSMGTLSDRFGRKNTLIFSLAVGSLLMLLFLSVRGSLQILVLLPLGFLGLSVNTLLVAIAQGAFPENRALANGMYGGMAFVVFAVSVALMGVLGDAIGLHAAFVASAVINLLAVPIAFSLPARSNATLDVRPSRGS